MNDFWSDHAAAFIAAWVAFLVGVAVGASQF